MILILNLTDNEIELLKDQLNNDNCGPRGEGWKSNALEELINKVDVAITPPIGIVVFDGKDGRIINNNSGIKKVVKIGTGHYKFE